MLFFFQNYDSAHKFGTDTAFLFEYTHVDSFQESNFVFLSYVICFASDADNVERCL